MPFRRPHALAAATAALLCGCGSGSSAPATSSAFVNAKPLRQPTKAKSSPHRRDRRSAAATVGATRRVNAGDAQLEVTVRRLIDPLRDSGASLLPKTHAVGALVQIRNVGSSVYDSSATGDFSIVSSRGAAPPLFAPHGVCQTQLRDFDNYITAGEVRDGCVVFAVPDGARVTAVRFSPHAQAVHRVSWTSAH